MTTPAWLARIQREFTDLLATPLDRSTGRLLSREGDYPRELLERVVDAPPIAPAERLAVYHRQYWYRLLDLLQTSFPVSTRLLGHYHFNEPAALYFSAHPPRSRDLDRDADGFPDFFDAWARGARPAVAEYLSTGMALDRAFRQVFAAPRVDAFVPTPDLAPRILGVRLVPSPERALYRERWPLLRERSRIVADQSERPWKEPPRLPEEEAYLIARSEGGISFAPLAVEEARLYELLARETVGAALGLWQEECGSGSEHDDAQKAQSWLERSVRLRLWSGCVDA